VFVFKPWAANTSRGFFISKQTFDRRMTMQRTSQTLIDKYIQSCKERDESRFYFRDELYDEDIRNTYLNIGLENLANIFLFNPKKIDREIQRFKDQPFEIRNILLMIAEELATNPKLCRKNILYAVYDVFNKKGTVPDCRISLEKLTLAQTLCCGLSAYMNNYIAWIPSYQTRTDAIYFFEGKNLAKCWRQFCAILLIIDDLSTLPITVRFGWNSDADTINNNDWQLLCRIIANTKIKLSIVGMNKLSDSSSFISEKKLKALVNVAAITKKIPSLREAASYALFSGAKAILQRNQANDRYFIDIFTTNGCIRQECTQGEMELLEKTQTDVLGRISIKRK
jgi:hypothetical protein